MDAETADAILKRHIVPLMERLRLDDWHVEVTTIEGETDDGIPGRVTVSYEYRRAYITIDASQIDEEDELARVLRHELIHVVLWPMHATGALMEAALPVNRAGHALLTALTDHRELLVGQVERVLDKTTD